MMHRKMTDRQESGWDVRGPDIEAHAPNRAAFTLIELLIVIAIIGFLAGMIVMLLPGMAMKRTRSRVKTELSQVESAIDNYKVQRGFYPPDNPANPGTNSLYYELSSTALNQAKTIYTTVWGDTLPVGSISATFGASGFINSNFTADDAKNYHSSLRTNSQAKVFTVNGAKVRLLGVSVKGPIGDFCPYFYNMSNPTHNPNGYDLWVEVLVSGQVRRYGNWKED